jgi:hypothetical protein
MLLTSIAGRSFKFKVPASDRIFCTSLDWVDCTLESVVVGKEIAIMTRNLMQPLDMACPFSESYPNTRN